LKLQILRKEITMLSDRLRSPAVSTHLFAAIDTRIARLFCLLLLTAACVLASLAFACATPFAAFAALAGAMLPLSAALLVVMAAWIVNQAIGFGVLGYPMEMNTLLWGLAIGVAALAATAVSAQVPRYLPQGGRAATLTLAVIAAYAAYEIVLLAFAPDLGGSGAFTMTIIARLGLLNVVWMLGLVAACEIAVLLIAATRRRLT
jgi:hypothetical protein